MNPAEMNHFVEDVFFLYQNELFLDIFISEVEHFKLEILAMLVSW